ncbi:heavy-metal-associated domain-containing protein [Halorussus halophilus]|uniref:heavy-metal-associated domain-containing protein n=1 Tax=Halorussus halophilus TaxID=2650975 RepID=UPI0013016E12|nr:heavy metal-associated domain-containing protein [Halorussus halophilus]
MEQYTVPVTGMVCKSCENVVRQEITALSGVASVDPDATGGEVTVQGEPTTEPRVRQAIEEIGYAVGE